MTPARKTTFTFVQLIIVFSSALLLRAAPAANPALDRLKGDLKSLPEEVSANILQDLKPRPEELAKDIIRGSKSVGSRDLKNYLEIFPTEFSGDLARLGARGTLVDSGAGEAYFAEQYLGLRQDFEPTHILGFKSGRNYRALLNRPASERARVTAIDLEVQRKNIPTFDGKLKILSGRFFEDIPNAEIGEADLISDLYGVFAYSPRVDEVLRKYVQLLKDDGRIYIFLGFNPRDSFAYRSSVRTKSGARLSLVDWVKQLPGLDTNVLQGSGSLWEGKSNVTFQIRVANRARLKIPELALREINEEPGGPPLRFYLER